MTTLISKLRHRAQLVRDGEAEGGFILIYVLMIITIVTVLVGSTLVIAAGSVIPATHTAYDQAAEAAAQSGLQNFLSTADTTCAGPSGTITACTTMPAAGSGSVYTDANYSSKFSWTSVKGTKYFRVTSTGTVVQGGITAKKTLTADIAGGVSPNLPDYSYVTQYETQAPDVTQQLFPTRDIALNATAISNADIGSGSSVHWNGAATGTAAGTVNVCNTVFYPTATSSGRVNNPPPAAPTPYVDWSEAGTVNGTSYTNYQPCQVSFGHSTKLLAPTSTANGLGGIRSNDAFLFSNSYPGGTGPTLNQPVTTGYQYDPAVDGSCGTSGLNYRSFNLTCAGYPAAGDVGGTPAAGSSLPQYNGSLPVWSTSNPTIPGGACWYQGPTRVKLNADGSATITSPQTTGAISPSPAACYGTGGPNGSTGMIAVNVPNIATVSGGVIRVVNDGTAPATTPTIHTSTGWAGVNTRAPITAANSVFYASIPASGPTVTNSYVATAPDAGYTPAKNDNPSKNHPDGSWQPQWTSFASSTGCSNSPVDLGFYSCYANAGSYLSGAYGALKTAVQNALQANAASYTTATDFAADLTSVINNVVSKANSGDAANSTPTNGNSASHRWRVSVSENPATAGGCTPALPSGGTTTSAIPAPINDPLFGNTNGVSSVTTQVGTRCFTATITLQIGQSILGFGKSWGDGGLLGLGLVAGSSIPQFQVTETLKTTTVTTSATAATSQFPIAGDVTPYAMASSSTSAPGDLYVEGTATASMALIAQNDIVITSGLGTASASNGLEIIGQNNVRVYHPVGCVSTDATALAATTAGFCPNDITGLYKGVLPTAARPDQQYSNLLPAADLNVTGLIFALGNASSTVPCPKFGTSGICGGEFTADNYNRGNALGTLTLTGGVYMAHHGPLGQEWEIPATTGQSSRPYSGYQFTDRYLNLTSALSAFSTILKTTSSTPFYWRIISVSTAPNPASP